MRGQGSTLRPALTVPRILDAAVELVDEEGLESLTMRALGERLGVAAMALYNHVPDKQELVVLAANHVLEAVTLPDADLPARAWVQQLVDFTLTLLLARPRVTELILHPPQHLLRANATNAQALREKLTSEGASAAAAASVMLGIGALMRAAGTEIVRMARENDGRLRGGQPATIRQAIATAADLILDGLAHQSHCVEPSAEEVPSARQPRGHGIP